MNIQRIHNAAHEAACIQAIRARHRREMEASIVTVLRPSEKVARHLARVRANGGPVGRLAQVAVKQIEGDA